MLDPTKKKIPHIQGQRRSPSKMVGRVKLCLESNSIATRDSQGLKQTLYAPGFRDPRETESELCLSASCGGIGQQRTAAGAEALGAVDLGMA